MDTIPVCDSEKKSSHGDIEEICDYNNLLAVLAAATLPEQEYDLAQTPEPECLKSHVLKSEINLYKAVTILTGVDKSLTIPNEVLIQIILVIGEHSKIEKWTNCNCIMYSQQLLKEVLEQTGHTNVLNLLLHHNVDFFLSELRPKLLKNSWKNYPAAVSCFTWILFNLKCPHMGEIIQSILPTCLLLVDDHVYSNKVVGLQCLQHVISNVSRANLNQYGRGSVIYNAVEHMIYLREPEIIRPLALCLIALLNKTEHNSTLNTLSWSHFDDVLNIWLPSMELEQRLALREAYIDSLSELLKTMGLSSVRWSKKLLGVFSEYCEEDHTCNKSLQALLSFINATWPRISSYFRMIVIIIMKVVMKIADQKSTSSNTSDVTLKLVKNCFKSIELHCSVLYNNFLNDIKNSSDMKHYFLLLSEIENKC